MPNGSTETPDNGLNRVPNAELAKEVFDRALRCDGSPLTTEQVLRGYGAVCRVAHVAHALPDDKLIGEIRMAFQLRGAVWPELAYPAYNRKNEGAYEIVAAVISPGLDHEVCFWAMLAALLIVRPEDAHRLANVGAALCSVRPVG